MSLDIALPSPVSQNSANGGPPGAGPPTPANTAQPFAALLAQHRPQTTSAAPAASPKIADSARDDKARDAHSDKSGDKDAADDPANPGGLPVPLQTLPPEAIALMASLVVPGPAVPIAPAQAAAAAGSVNTLEAMDTSPASAPALPGGTALPSGGELLPQTIQTPAPAEEHAPALFSLPPAAPPKAKGAAQNQAQASALPGASVVVPAAQASAASGTSVPAPPPASPAVSAAMVTENSAAAAQGASPALPTKLALHQYAQFGQTALQNTAGPANNTSKASKDGYASAFQGKGALGKSVSLLSSIPPMTLTAIAAPASEQAALDWAQRGETQDNTTRGKSDKGGQDLSSLLPLPTATLPGETKTTAVSAAPLLPTDRAALMQQAADSMQALHAQVLGHGRGQMTLQLHPQDWGKLQVSVTMTPAVGNGGTTVTAHVVADSAGVKQALETGNADLRRTLREAGLHLERLTVTVRPAAASSEAQSMGSNSGGNGRQTPSQDTQWGTAPGSRGDIAANTMAGNGGTAFGGGGANTGAQNREHRQTTFTAPLMTDEHEEQMGIAAPASRTAGRLDTRA